MQFTVHNAKCSYASTHLIQVARDIQCRINNITENAVHYNQPFILWLQKNWQSFAQYEKVLSTWSLAKQLLVTAAHCNDNNCLSVTNYSNVNTSTMSGVNVSSGIKSGIKIERNFPPVLGWGPPQSLTQVFPLHFGLLSPLGRKLC